MLNTWFKTHAICIYVDLSGVDQSSGVYLWKPLEDLDAASALARLQAERDALLAVSNHQG